MDGASRGSRLRLCAAATAIVFAALGFAVGFDRGLPAGDLIARAALAAPSATPAAIVIPTGDGPALRDAIAAAPLDATVQAATISDLDQFVASHYPGHPEQAAVLRARGFATAAGSAWTRPGVRMATELVQFRDGDGAQGYLRALRASYIINARVIASFGVANVPDGYAYVLSEPGPSEPGPSASPGAEIDLFAQVGPVVAELTVVTTGPPDRQSDTAALVRQTGSLE